MGNRMRVCAVGKYKDADGNTKSTFSNVGMAFANTSQDGKKSISVRMNVICMAKEFVLFPVEEGEQDSIDDDVPF